MIKISVCLASYNGEKFIYEQICSVLDQLSADDELVVVDDCSTDNTVDVINSFKDKRIRLFLNKINRGVNYSFERAISLSENELIFMCDQDDVWIEGRLKLMSDTLLNSGCCLVSSNSVFIDEVGNDVLYPADGVDKSNSRKFLKNILDIFAGKKNYYGCAMAVRSKLIDLILPIPAFVESHDLWIAMAANLYGSNIHLDENTLKRRVHGSNASIVSRPLVKKIWSRVIFLVSAFVILYRIYIRRVI